MQNGGQGLDVLAKAGLTVAPLSWFLMILCSPTDTESPNSSEFGPSAFEIATGLPANAENDTRTKRVEQLIIRYV